MYQELLDKIEEYDKISIFRHLRPDGDAIFSSLGLKAFINANFKDKEVKLCGFETYDRYNTAEEVSDEFIRDSLAIICDVSDEKRTDDLRFKEAKYIIVIDHHPYFSKYAQTTINDSTCSATCELLANIFYSRTFSKFVKSEDCCKFLYCGLLTDSCGFSISSVTSRTLRLASYLIRDGKLNVSGLNEFVFNFPLEEYTKVTRLRSKLNIDGDVGFCLLDKEDLDEIDMTFDVAKNNVNEFSKIKELKVWAVFALNPKTNSFDGSIRSRKEYVINKLCERYNGGGHNNACGVKNLDKDTVLKLVEDLKDLSLK